MSKRRHGMHALAVLTLVNLFNYGNRNVLFPMYEDLRADFGFSNAELGLLGTAFMSTHAVVTLFFGWAGDRYDKRRVIAWGLVLWSISAVLSGLAVGFWSMTISRAMVGVGTAACVPVGIALLCQVFPEDTKARTVAIFNLGIFLGGAAGVGAGVIAGYPVGVFIMAVPGFLLAAMVLRLPVDHTPSNIAESTRFSWSIFVQQGRELLSIKTMIWVLIGSVLMAFAAGSYVSWLFEFISVTKGLGDDTASVIFGAALLGGLLGIVAGGWVGDRLQATRANGRLAAISIGMLSSLPFALIFQYSSPGALFYASSFLAMFFMTWYHGPLAAVIDDLSSADRATAAQAILIFTIHFVGTAPSSWIIGVLADTVGLREALLVPAGAILCGALCFIAGARTMAPLSSKTSR